jgi:tRNA (guanosine-2'-O-)-methyltransferase
MRTCDAVGVQELYVLNTKIPVIKNGGQKFFQRAKWLTVYQFENAEECFSELEKSIQKF